jgi:TolB protein
VLRQLGEQYVVHLLLIDVKTNEQRNLSGEQNLVDDGSPAWSPDGTQIAFRRKELEGATATLGKQLWLMRGDGSDARALTADPAFDHGQPVWSPDGRYLLFHKLPLKGPNITLSVWVMDMQNGEQWEVVRPGQRPVWMP